MKIAMFNQKGGTAKTTSTINIGYNLSKKYKTLLVDMDSQANLSQGIYTKKESHKDRNIYSVLKNEIGIKDAILKTKFDNLDLIPSHLELTSIDLDFSNYLARELIIKKRISEVEDDYKFILFDCSPTMGIATLNVLSACDYLIIPIDVGIFSFEGINRIINLVNDIRNNTNSDLEILGTVLTRANKRTTLTKKCFEKMSEYFDSNQIFNTILSESVNIIRSQELSIPIELFDNKLEISRQYAKLTNEVIKKINERYENE